MFTGLIKAMGKIITNENGKLIIEILKGQLGQIEVGDSIAVNGCCLTHKGGEKLSFDLSEETISRTTFNKLNPNAFVNLEPSLQVGEQFGGHFVLGHVDCIGELIAAEPAQNSINYRFKVQDSKYLVDKGSIALDGISLTVVKPVGNEFVVSAIPHTIENTNLKSLIVGSKVNVEYDILSRYIEKLISNR